MLVLEGIAPFLSPDALRKALAVMLGMDDNRLRLTGLASMIAGLVLLYFIR